MRLNPILIGKVVMACATFHNIASKDDFEIPEVQDVDGNFEPHEVRNGNVRLQELLAYFRY